MQIVRQKIFQAEKDCINPQIADPLILPVQHRRFGKIHIVQPSVMSADISHERDTFNPAFKICIADTISFRNCLLVLVLHILIKLGQRPKAEQLHKRIKRHGSVNIIMSEILDEGSLCVALYLDIHVIEKFVMVLLVRKICGIQIAEHAVSHTEVVCHPTAEIDLNPLDQRDCVHDLIDKQLYGAGDAEIAQTQERLNPLYDDFSAKYGLINDRPNRAAFAGLIVNC